MRLHDLVVGGKKVTDRVTSAETLLTGIQRLGAGAVHRVVPGAHVARQNVIHHAGVIVPMQPPVQRRSGPVLRSPHPRYGSGKIQQPPRRPSANG